MIKHLGKGVGLFMKQIIILTGIIVLLLTTNIEAKNINETIGIKGISQIDLKLTIGQVTIYESNSEKIEIGGSITGNSSQGVEVKRLGEVVNIKQKIGFFPVKFGVTEIMIGIPATFNKDITVSQSTGKLKIQKINVDSIEIKTMAASLDVDDILFKDLILKTGPGWSDIDLKRKSGNIVIDSGVGKVKLKVDKIGGDIRFNGGTVGGTLVIPQNAPVDITNLGNKKGQISALTSDEGLYNIFIKPGVGKLKVIN